MLKRDRVADAEPLDQDALAKHLGFRWRDVDPIRRGVDRMVPPLDRGPAILAIRQRILDYNEDDCRATAVLLDGIRALA